MARRICIEVANGKHFNPRKTAIMSLGQLMASSYPFLRFSRQLTVRCVCPANPLKTVKKKPFKKVRSDELYTKHEYDIYTSNSGIIQNKLIQGCYLLCDNGYLNWVILQCPSTSFADGPLYYWSKRLETVRKDIECVFGRFYNANVVYSLTICPGTHTPQDRRHFHI